MNKKEFISTLEEFILKLKAYKTLHEKVWDIDIEKDREGALKEIAKRNEVQNNLNIYSWRTRKIIEILWYNDLLSELKIILIEKRVFDREHVTESYNELQKMQDRKKSAMDNAVSIIHQVIWELETITESDFTRIQKKVKNKDLSVWQKWWFKWLMWVVGAIIVAWIVYLLWRN
jgi:hypothetical protein